MLCGSDCWAPGNSACTKPWKQLNVMWLLEKVLLTPRRDRFAITKFLHRSISCSWRTRATRCITANVLQTKVDAQCDKLATELSWQHFRRLTFSSYSKLFVESRQCYLPHLHLTSPLGVTPIEFCRNLRRQKTGFQWLSFGVVSVIIRVAVSVEHRLVSDRQTDRRRRRISQPR